MTYALLALKWPTSGFIVCAWTGGVLFGIIVAAIAVGTDEG